MLEGLNLFAAPFFSLKLKESRMLEYRGSPGDPQAFQEIHRLFRRSTGFPGDPQAFQKIHRLSRRSTGFPGSPDPFQEASSFCRISTAFPGSLLAFRKADTAIFAFAWISQRISR
jgi:hypothetical protein